MLLTTQVVATSSSGDEKLHMSIQLDCPSMPTCQVGSHSYHVVSSYSVTIAGARMTSSNA